MKPGWETRVDPEARRRIAAEQLVLGQWVTATRAYCVCPGVGSHSQQDGKRDCRVELDAALPPTIHCFHGSCSGAVDEANQRLRSAIGKAECVRVTAPTGQRPGLRTYDLRAPSPFKQRAKKEIRGVRSAEVFGSDASDGQKTTPPHTRLACAGASNSFYPSETSDKKEKQ